MEHRTKVFVAGHCRIVGSALVRRQHAGSFTNVITRLRTELDLLDQRAVTDFLGAQRPDYIFIAVAKVSGIQANICAVPTDLCGRNDNWDLASSHVLPALIRKAHEACERGSTRIRRMGQRRTTARVFVCR